MSTENWPEPKRIIGKLGDLCTFKSLQTNKGDEVYTATQVQEIVRMEVESISKLVKAEWLTEADREYGKRLTALIRAKIKENKDAD